jgi:DNA-directed RNA polymerase specialized sigma24 family protein
MNAAASEAAGGESTPLPHNSRVQTKLEPRKSPSLQPFPEYSALIADECQQLPGLLLNQQPRQAALMKMEGYTHQEIAERLGCSLRSVARKVELIRAI